MISARATATFACCGARATPDSLSGHKCNLKGRGASAGVAVRSGLGNAAPSHCAAPELTGGERGRKRHPAPSKPRAGKAAEDALADLLAGPCVVVPFRAWISAPQTGPEVIVREFEWGIGLEPRRRFRCDFLHLASGVMVEIEGGAHGVQRQRRGDILRAQLAEQAGYRIVRVLPEQVHNGEALALVRRALGGE